jgi:hypothetical protein
MKRFVANEWDKSRAARRGGGQPNHSLDTECAEARYMAEVLGRME